VISEEALLYGFRELSKSKRSNYLEAEFPHFWKHIKKFRGRETEYTSSSIQTILGENWKTIADDLVAIGFLARKRTSAEESFIVPPLYVQGMDLVTT